MKQLEPRNVSPEALDGLQARVHDPMWMLARQWQTGEFKGDDAGTPVGAWLSVESAPVTRYRPGSASAATAPRDYKPAELPLETLVEREAVYPATGNNLRLAAQAGLQYTRLLARRGLRPPAAFTAAFVIPSPTAAERDALDAGTLRYLAVMAGRVVDGRALYARLAPSRPPGGDPVLPSDAPFAAIPATERPATISALREWMDWYDRLFSQPGAGDTAWLTPRMEYAFAVSSLTSRGEATLAAAEYADGRLDWFSFDVDPAQPLGASGPVSAPQLAAFMPGPVSFPGMPARRYWELENGRVNLVGLTGKDQTFARDPARALLLDFALDFGGDWFTVPVEMAVGMIGLVRALVVTNSFGEKLLLRHASQVDGASTGWRMFSLSAARPDPSGAAPKFVDAFFLPPVLGPVLEGAPVEDVLLLRDEMANMAWAVERTVESPSGGRLNRQEELAQRRPPAPPTGTGTSAYRLGVSIPAHWIPFLPAQNGPIMELRRGALPAGAAQGSAGPLGRLIVSGHILMDEEVPREGARVTRNYEYARWTDGSSHLWVGRCKEPGRGEGSSGLRFDVLEPN
jgi:hypothetical protein